MVGMSADPAVFELGCGQVDLTPPNEGNLTVKDIGLVIVAGKRRQVLVGADDIVRSPAHFLISYEFLKV
jgi:hypothetical protein